MRFLFLCALIVVFTPVLHAEPEIRVRKITINNLGVFDSQHEDFRSWPFRFLNRLHIKTQQSFIRNELLVKEGDVLIADVLRESERNLRRYSFLTDVSIKAKHVNDREVDLLVNTEDQWTTRPNFSLGKTSGARTLDIGLQEENFLGLGRRVGILYEKSPERDGLSGSYGDPRFLNTRLKLDLRYSHFTDGHRLNYGLTQPFYSQQTRWSYGMEGSDSRRLQHFYTRGGTDAAALENVRRGGAFEVVRAWGERYQRNRMGFNLGYSELSFPSTVIFDPDAAQEEEIQRNLNPDERTLFNVGMNFVRDRQKFVKFYYMDNFGRTEDLPYGTHSGFSIVHSSDAGDDDFITGNFHGRYTFHRDARHYFVSFAGLSVRRESGEWNNWISEGLLRYYLQRDSTILGLFNKSKHTLASNLAAMITADVDAPFQLSLGEDEGLRGYAFREFTGSNRALFNVEYRMLVPWQNRLVALSIVPFSDTGYVWNPDHHLAVSAGLGLRIGFKKYGRTRVLRIDYAFPLVDRKGRGGSLSVSAGQAFDIL